MPGSMPKEGQSCNRVPGALLAHGKLGGSEGTVREQLSAFFLTISPVLPLLGSRQVLFSSAAAGHLSASSSLIRNF